MPGGMQKQGARRPVDGGEVEVFSLHGEGGVRGGGEFVAYCDAELQVRWASGLEGVNVPDGGLGMVGRHCYEALYGRERPCEDCPAEAVLRTGEPAEGVTETPDGRVWQLRCYPVRGEEGQVTGVMKVVRETTGDAQEGSRLEYHRGLNEILLDLSVSMAGLSRGGTDERISQALGRMGELMGVDRCCVFEFREGGRRMDNTHEWCRKGIMSARASSQDLEAEAFWSVREVLKRGRVLNVPDVSALGGRAQAEQEEFCRQGIRSLVYVPMEWEGRPLGFVGFDAVREERVWGAEAVGLLQAAGQALAGVLEHRRTVEALQDSEELLSIAFKASPVAVSITDLATGRFIDVNESFVKQFGYQREELIGRTSMELDIWVDMADRAALVEGLRKRGSVAGMESKARCKDGSEITMLMSAGLMERGDKSFMVGLSEDITGRKEAERRVLEDQATLAHLARVGSMGELASGIAHELNQPLAAISFLAEGCLWLLNSAGVKEERVTEGLRGICKEAYRAGEIIRGMRQFLRKEGPEREGVDVNEVVREAVRLLSYEARERRASVRLELGEGCRAMADRVQVEQVVLNLLSNALESLEAAALGSRGVTVTTVVREGGRVEVAVADEGCGFAAEAADRLFDPFYTTKAEGMGMGLSLSRSIVESHGGSLWADPNEPSGAVFRFTLPAENRRAGS